MSIAYLEIGEVAAKNENMTDTYQNAVAYQLHHALELFVKYAILKQQGKVSKKYGEGHNLAYLFNEYDKLYPKKEYRLEHPFDFNSYESCELNIDEQEMYENHINNFEPKIMDQHLRYPADHKTGGYSFKIESDYFSSTKEKFLDIYSKINC
jgi:hypothetical protein